MFKGVLTQDILRKRRIIYFLLIGVLFGGVAAITDFHKDAARFIFNKVSGIDQEYYEKMQSIKIGMTKDQVVSILGAPSEISKEKEIVQTHGMFGSGQHYGKVIINKNICLIYYHGADIIGHYFINNNGKVIFINLGGT